MSWKKSWIIVNPKSGGVNSLDIKNTIKESAKALGWQGEYYESTSVKNSQDLIRKAVKAKVNHVIIGGGDGTIRSLLKIIIQKELTIGIIPLGTGNILAKNLSIPLDLESAIPVALKGEIKRIDIGKANQHYFSVATGMGIDVEAMEKTSKTSKKLFGIFAYIWALFQSILKSRNKYHILIDNKDRYTFRAQSILVANMAYTIANIKIAPGAGPKSNNFKVVIVNTKSVPSWINLLANLLKGDLNDSPYYHLYNAKSVKIYPHGSPKKYECDGDNFPPVDELVVKLFPQALKIRLPKKTL